MDKIEKKGENKLAYKKVKKAINVTLASVMLVPTFLTGPAFAVNTSVENNGLWITEIYANDYSKKNIFKNLDSNGKLSDDDHFEFVEITNTTNKTIDFNKDGYSIWYSWPKADGSWGEKTLKVEGLNGEDIVINPGDSVIFWNQRTDLANYGTEAQFREEMNVDPDVKVYRVSGQNGFASGDRIFSIKNPNGDVISRYHYSDAGDGLVTHLSIPHGGVDMAVYRDNDMSSIGSVSVLQLNGHSLPTKKANVIDGVYITEIRPADINRDDKYGSKGNQIMEGFELYNTGNKTYDLNKDYSIYYTLKEGSSVPMPLYRLVGDNLVQDNITIDPGQTVVVWPYRKNMTLNGKTYGLKESEYTSFPTEEEYRKEYDIPNKVPVYVEIDQNGLGNDKRGIDLFKVEADGTSKLVSRKFYTSALDIAGGKSVETKVPAYGTYMDDLNRKSPTTFGKVDPNQFKAFEDDGIVPEISLLEDEYHAPVNDIERGKVLKIPYRYDKKGTELPFSITLYYKTDKMEAYKSDTSTWFAMYNQWDAYIPSTDLVNAEYVDYYVVASTPFNSTTLPERRINVYSREEKNNGLGLYFDREIPYTGLETIKKDYVDGRVRFSVKNFDNENSTLSAKLDGNDIELKQGVYPGAYFTFDHFGVSGYFKNALLKDDEVIKIFPKNSYTLADGSSTIFVDGAYFDINSDGSATGQFRIVSGTVGSHTEIYSEENNEDMSIQNMALVMEDGTEIKPTKIIGTKNETGNKDEYKDGEKIDIGDSNNKQNLFVDMTFEIPAKYAKGYVGNFESEDLENGSHTLEISSSDGKTITKDFKVNNHKSEPKEENPEILELALVDKSNDEYEITPQASEADKVTIYKANEVSDFKVSEGYGNSTSNTEEVNGFKEVKSINGKLPYNILTFTANENEDIKVELEAKTDYSDNIQLFVLENNNWKNIKASNKDGKVEALFNTANRVNNGEVKVLVQGGGSELSPRTAPQGGIDTTKNDFKFIGDNIPEQYDFSIAWITDTQYYSEQYNHQFEAVTNWLVENKDKLGIQYVIHTGDIADEFEQEYQFAFADKMLKKLDNANLPYGVLAGNHDEGHGNAVYDLYSKYFGEDRFKDKPTYGGSYKDNRGHYDLLNIGGQEYIFIYMGWDLHKEEADWMNQVLDKYPERTAFILNHPGVNSKGEDDYFTRYVTENVAKNHKNVYAILNGHYHGSAMNNIVLDEKTPDERVLYRILTDYQSAPEGGSGYIKMLYFDLANEKIYINSYSPTANDFNYYDRDKLDNYGTNVSVADIDKAVLNANFKNEPKTLNINNAKIYKLGEEVLTTTPGSNLKISGVGSDILGVYTDKDGKVLGYSSAKKIGKSNTDEPTKPEEPIRPTPLEPSIPVDPTPEYPSPINRDNNRRRYNPFVSGFFFGNGNISNEVKPVAPKNIEITDIAGHWAEKPIREAVNKGYMELDNGKFFPNVDATRLGYVKALAKLAKVNPADYMNKTVLNDVKAGTKDAGYVNWAYEKGIIKGTGEGDFEGDRNITRQEIATILNRYEKAMNLNLSKKDIVDFSDNDKIADWAKEDVKEAHEKGIFNGKDNNMFDPLANITRAEVAQVVVNMDR